MILKHKNIDVCKINFDGRFHIDEIFNKEHMPVGVNSEYKDLLDRQLQSWFDMRTIPYDRQEMNRIKAILNCNIQDALVKGLGLSLTDCYWTTSKNDNIKWEDINFYKNGFDDSFGKFILQNKTGNINDYNFPDITTDGFQKKAWILINNIPSLVKYGDFGNSVDFGKNILSANEVITYHIANDMNIDAVQYYKIKNGNDNLCVCKSFIKDDQSEFVNALQIKNEYNLTSMGLYNWFAKRGFSNNIDDMIGFDYLIRNIDRHEKNFGIIRHPDSLEIKSFAPIFDNGTSLLFDGLKNEETKPFKQNRQQQLNLVTKNINIPNIDFVENVIIETYQNFNLPTDLALKVVCDIKENIEKIKEHNKILTKNLEMDER